MDGLIDRNTVKRACKSLMSGMERVFASQKYAANMAFVDDHKPLPCSNRHLTRT